MPRPLHRLFENKMFTRGNTALYESPIENAPRCVLLRDSFANYLVLHMIPAFSRLLVLGSTSMHYDMIRSEKPDMVIFEIAERFFGYLDGEGWRWLPQDISPVSFKEFSGVDLEMLFSPRLDTPHVVS